MHVSAARLATVWKSTFLLTIALTLTACGGGDNDGQNVPAGDADTDQNRKELTIGITQYPSTMHPKI